MSEISTKSYPQAKGAQAVAPEVMEELEAMKAMTNRALSSQQKQSKAAQGDSKKGKRKPRTSPRKRIRELVMDAVAQDISLETTPTQTRSL